MNLKYRDPLCECAGRYECNTCNIPFKTKKTPEAIMNNDLINQQLQKELDRFEEQMKQIDNASKVIMEAEQKMMKAWHLQGFEHEITLDDGSMLSWEVINDNNNTKVSRIMLSCKDNISGDWKKPFMETKTRYRLQYYQYVPQLLKELNEKIEKIMKGIK